MMEATLLSIGVIGKDDLMTIETTQKLLKRMLVWSTSLMNKKCRKVAVNLIKNEEQERPSSQLL